MFSSILKMFSNHLESMETSYRVGEMLAKLTFQPNSNTNI